MLKLVARSFYSELIKYGVNNAEVLRVAGHLLDNVMHNHSPEQNGTEDYNRLFTVNDVRDEWVTAKRLSVGEVTIAPLHMDLVPLIANWLRASPIRASFHPGFPDSERDLACHLRSATRDYFAISYRLEPVGIIGAEHIDAQSSKIEMRKLVGDPAMHGKGIGKRATFLFLYHVFVIREFEKVYVYSMDTNIRNLNLNAGFGFELEGVFIQDVMIQNERRDLVRMALLRSVWLERFTGNRRQGSIPTEVQ